MSAQRRTATKRRSSTQRKPSAATPLTADAASTTVDQPAAKRVSVVKPPTVEERSRQRAEAKAAARKQAEEAGRTGGIVGKVVAGERTKGVQKFVRETMAEIRKVSWPDQDTTRNLTIVVIGVSVVLGLLLGGIDYVLYQIFEAL